MRQAGRSISTALVVVIAMFATSVEAKAPVPAARNANTRGMALYHKKDYKAAAEEFRRAISLDEGYVQPHYNLICALELAGEDLGGEVGDEVVWLFSRAAFDPIAKEKLKKARHDPDLAKLLEIDPSRDAPEAEPDEHNSNARMLSDPDPEEGAYNLLNYDRKNWRAVPLAKDQRVAANQILAKLPGNHDARCDRSHPQQGAVHELRDDLGSGMDAFRASLADGLSLFERDGTLIARSEPFGCLVRGDAREKLSYSAIIPSLGDYEYVVRYTTGIEAHWTDEVSILRLREPEKELVRVFHAVLANNDDPRPAKLKQTRINDIIFSQPKSKTANVYRWDDAKFRYVQYWPAP